MNREFSHMKRQAAQRKVKKNKTEKLKNWKILRFGQKINIYRNQIRQQTQENRQYCLMQHMPQCYHRLNRLQRCTANYNNDAWDERMHSFEAPQLTWCKNVGNSVAEFIASKHSERRVRCSTQWRAKHLNEGKIKSLSKLARTDSLLLHQELESAHCIANQPSIRHLHPKCVRDQNRKWRHAMRYSVFERHSTRMHKPYFSVASTNAANVCDVLRGINHCSARCFKRSWWER